MLIFVTELPFNEFITIIYGYCIYTMGVFWCVNSKRERTLEMFRKHDQKNINQDSVRSQPGAQFHHCWFSVKKNSYRWLLLNMLPKNVWLSIDEEKVTRQWGSLKSWDSGLLECRWHAKYRDNYWSICFMLHSNSHFD